MQIAIIDAAAPPAPLVKAAGKNTFDWAEHVGGYKIFPCHAAQLDILKSKAKFTFAFAGSGGGKTCIIPLWLFKQITKTPKGRFLVVSPTLPIFESSELKRHILDTFEATSYEGEWLDGKKVYRLPTGGEIIIKTVGDGGDYQRLTGGQYDAIVADEVYFLTKEVWEEIRRRSNIRNAPILAVTTPNANNWIYEIKLEAERGNKDYYLRQWPTANNPASNNDHLDRERLLMSEAAFKRMYQGEFAALEGLVYDCFSDPLSTKYPVIPGKPDRLPSRPLRFVGGNDWGYRPDPSAVLIAAECEDGNLYIVEEIYGTEITPDDLAVRVRAMVDRWALRVDSIYADIIDGGRFVGFYTDVSRPEETAMFRKAGIPTKNKRVVDVLAGIKITDSWFRAGRLKIFSTCVNLIRECRGYQWDADKSGGLKDKPKGGNDHAADALRYLISSHKYGAVVTPTDYVKPTDADEMAKLISQGVITSGAQLKELEREKENERRRRWTLAKMFEGIT